jgi:hypothetical protein
VRQRTVRFKAGSADSGADRAHTHRPPDQTINSKDQLTYDLSLILMYLSSWSERPGEAPRFWKGFGFEVLSQLDEEGFIQGSRRAKSAYLTNAGIQRARDLLAHHRLETSG